VEDKNLLLLYFVISYIILLSIDAVTYAIYFPILAASILLTAHLEIKMSFHYHTLVAVNIV